VVEEIVIVPEPSAEERAAIVAALADESSEVRPPSRWPDALLPGREDDES
jgi:hypothetical protein